MNWLVGFAPVLKRTSLILTGSTFRTLAVAVSARTPREPAPGHSALALKKPAPIRAGGVTSNVALALAPGATGSTEVDEIYLPDATAVHPAGTETDNLT